MAGVEQLQDVHRFTDIHQVIGNPEIDLVDIVTPSADARTPTDIGGGPAASRQWGYREVSGVDPVTFAGVSALLLVVGLLAGYFPARQASLLDPVHALKLA